jgi:hypothetical protein
MRRGYKLEAAQSDVEEAVRLDPSNEKIKELLAQFTAVHGMVTADPVTRLEAQRR